MQCEAGFRPDIIAVYEVKPKQFTRHIQVSEFNIEGYEIIAMNISNDSEGRGMLCYIKNGIRYSQCQIEEIKFQEVILFEIALEDR